MRTLVLTNKWFCPTFQNILRQTPNICHKLEALWFSIRAAWNADVALRACSDSYQKIDMSENLEIVATNSRARFCKIPTSARFEACAHEHVEDVVNILLGKTKRQNSPGEVAVTAAIEIFVSHDAVSVWVAPTTDDIMNACVVAVDAIVDGVRHDGGEGAKIWHAGPERMSSSEMRSMQLPSLG